MQNKQHNIDFLELVEECRPFVKEISIHELKQKLDRQESFTLIDVREAYEWNQGYIRHAKHMARGTIDRDVGNNITDKESEIVLYCSGGFRSILAAFNLQKMGYKNVKSMSGGLKYWLDVGYEITLDE